VPPSAAIPIESPAAIAIRPAEPVEAAAVPSANTALGAAKSAITNTEKALTKFPFMSSPQRVEVVIDKAKNRLDFNAPRHVHAA
jgi:hypothetical protein